MNAIIILCEFIRAISDTTDDSEYEAFKESVAKNCAQIVEYMVGNM